jgi:anti-sigma B factor antagonist
MAFQVERKDGRLCVSGEMTIYSAAAMKDYLVGELLAAVDGPLSLDVSRVTEIDTCGVQALLMVQRSVTAGGHSLSLVDASPVVREALGLCGLDSLCADTAKAA